MVLVPGMDGTGELFYRQVPRLERSYRVATYALREDAESLDLLAADLARVVDVVAPVERRAIIVGESFGGAVALTFALSHQERVGALVILNSFPTSPHRFDYGWPSPASRSFRGGPCRWCGSSQRSGCTLLTRIARK